MQGFFANFWSTALDHHPPDLNEIQGGWSPFFTGKNGSGWFLGEGGLIWDLYCSVETMGTKHISWMVLILKMVRDGFLVEC